MSGEEQLVSQDEGVMSLGSEGSEQLLDSSTKKNSDGQDIGESSKAKAADAEAFAEAGSRAPAAPVVNPVDPPSKDTAAPSASAPVYEKTYRLKPSLVNAAEIANYVERGYFEAGKARPPGDEVVPQPRPNEAVVFRDYYEAGLRLPAWGFLERVLERYSIKILHLTPNAFVQLSKFIWAVRSQNAKLSSDAFICFYSCHLQNKKVPFDDDVFHSQYGLCTFQPRYFGRRSKVKKVALIPAQKNRWGEWMDYWFYAKVPREQGDDGTECYPLASQLVAAEPIFSPGYESTSTFQPCCKAFRTSCKVISGRTAVEEFIAVGIWPIARGWKADDFVERRIGGRKFRYLCPIFDGLKKPEGLRPKQFVEIVEDVANLLCDPFTVVEAQDVEEGLLLKCRVNRIFDNLMITYPDHEVARGRRRLKKGGEPEIPTTCYIHMRGWEKKTEAAVEASPSTTASVRSGSRVTTRKMKASTAAGLSIIKAERLKRKRTMSRGARGAAGPDSTRTGSNVRTASGNTERASGSHAEASVAGGSAELDDEMPPVFELYDSEVLLDAPGPEVFAEEPVIELSDSEEFLDGSDQ
ncbi:hypothetical protein EJB05_52927, partial [Eragrostis curvula]